MGYLNSTANFADTTAATPSFSYGIMSGNEANKLISSNSSSNLRKDQPVSLDLGKTMGMPGSTKQILLIDDDRDTCLAIKACLEAYSENDAGIPESVLQITAFSDPIRALHEFKSYYYDLLLVDVNMPDVNGYELVEKIIRLDLNIKVCFMTAGEINYEAIAEIHHPARSLGCFIKKPAAHDYLINRVMQELC